jgi:hypothetical protein
MHRTYYIYQADTYCQPCGQAICISLILKLDYNDSDGWPKVASTLQGECDYPDHCAKCEELLGLNLTTEGYEYIKEQASHGITDTVQEWIDYYQVELD